MFDVVHNAAIARRTGSLRGGLWAAASCRVAEAFRNRKRSI